MTNPTDNIQSGKRQSISRQVKLGLGVIVLSLATVSVFSLLGFYTLSKGVNFLSNESVPRIVEGAAVTRRVNELLIATERLIAARTAPIRRAAFTDINQLLEELQEDIPGDAPSEETLKRRIDVLKESVIELNEIVASRIDISTQTNNAISQLFAYADELSIFKTSLLQGSADEVSEETVASWIETTSRIINLAASSITINSRYKAKRLMKNLDQLFADLDRITLSMPVLVREDAYKMTQQLHSVVMGDTGLIPLKNQQIAIVLQHSGRGNFARTLVDDTTSTIITQFNLELTDVSTRVETISLQGNSLAVLFAIVTFGAIIIAVGVTIYLQKMVVNRIVDLNQSILARIDGQKAVIAPDGNDEITEMTRSFLFYENEVSQREKELSALAMKDALTGAWNRRKFIQSGEDLAKIPARYGNPLTLMMMDLDHFKKINDSYGHGVGDIVLQNVAKLCLEAMRDVDIFARIGGEEFAALLPETGLEDAKILAERIRTTIEDQVWPIKGSDLNCTVSIGLACLPPDSDGEPESLKALMSRADDALYTAKQTGRNRVVLASTIVQAAAS